MPSTPLTTCSDLPEPGQPESKHPESGNPERCIAVIALPVLANWLPAVALAAALFMPHVTGCNSQPVRPLDLMSDYADQPLKSVAICWQHLYGLFAFALFAIVLATDRSRSDRKLAWGTIGCWVFLVAIVMVPPIVEGSTEPAEYMGVLPLIVLPSFWCYAALKRRDWISAWARMASSIALLGVIWTFLSYLFNRGPRYGIFLTYGCLLLMAIAPWWLRIRWRQVLIGSSEPATPIRFRIWHLLVTTALFSLIYGYYRYLVPVFED